MADMSGDQLIDRDAAGRRPAEPRFPAVVAVAATVVKAGEHGHLATERGGGLQDFGNLIIGPDLFREKVLLVETEVRTDTDQPLKRCLVDTRPESRTRGE